MAGPVRISGLIRLADVVRRELGSATMTAGRRDHLRKHVSESLEAVQKILHANGAGAHNMPAPSRRAFKFLSDVNWGSAATSQAPAEPEKRTIISWRGLGSFLDVILDKLGNDLSNPEIAQTAAAITRMSRQMELTIQRDSVTPDRMSDATRAQRGWLGFMSRPENWNAYVQSRRLASRIIDSAAAGSRHYPPPLMIHFRPMTGIYRLRATRSRPVLWLPTPMIAFDERGFAVLASRIFDRGGGEREGIIELMTGDGYQSLRAELESLGGIVEQSRGATHDLAASFERVNAIYFGGQMARPRLTWNRTFTGRKFGHYDYILDTVMVSRTLDSPAVPEFVVDFLMFHELLHKFHGMHWVNGRGYSHTSEFYQSERKFTRYAEAESVLEKLAREAGR